MSEEPDNRRPLKSRGARWAGGLAAALARTGISPNAISAGSLVFAVLGGGLLLAAAHAEGAARAGAFLAAGACVQLRLLCNLLDGMVAVEHGRAGPAGALWNELPDRFADLMFLVAAGYGAAIMGLSWGEALGWAAGALAVLTAYVRELGRALGQPADFAGPMAKPHRMAALTLACAGSALEPTWNGDGQVLAVGLVVIAAGTAWTVARRTLRLTRALSYRP